MIKGVDHEGNIAFFEEKEEKKLKLISARRQSVVSLVLDDS